MIKKICSCRGQISLEFSILMFAGITAAALLGYYMLKSAINVKNTNIEIINKTSDATMNALKTVN
ncbi:class III signal peptide-containing protein [Methanothermococcus sp.]|uniref:class III signal peptide-containing protein n=1 Tax=Methanothermococcus sp. TaxID=2614238 RepID=UPI0025D1E001|nr:class III signal peptide-containing protein [Methanothermococcus sp.]